MSLGSIYKKRLVLATAVAVWAIVVGVGLRTLLLYSQTPGALASPPSAWPSRSPVSLARGRMSLVIFPPPPCPCTRASLGELALILASCPREVEPTVLFYRYEKSPPEWAQ